MAENLHTECLHHAIDTFAEEDGLVYRRTVTDVTPVIEFNKRLQAEEQRFAPVGDYKPIANLPLSMVPILKERHGIDIYNPDHKAAFRKWLADPDNRYFRATNRL